MPEQRHILHQVQGHVTQDKVTLKWVLWPTQHIVRRPIRIESIEKIVSSGCFEALGRVPQVKMGGEY